MPLIILSIDSFNLKEYHKVSRINVDNEYYVPIDLLYTSSSSLIFFGVDE